MNQEPHETLLQYLKAVCGEKVRLETRPGKTRLLVIEKFFIIGRKLDDGDLNNTGRKIVFAQLWNPSKYVANLEV